MNDQIRCQHCGGFTPIDDELQKLRAENAKLREALMPFAAVATKIQQSEPDRPDGTYLATYGGLRITMGHLRAAKAAVDSDNEKE